VTDDTGAVVYAAAHDPYGGNQQTWTNAYDPALKFSGKERDTESGLDYFGARYYDHSLYRFLSVDPVIPAGKAVVNPQRWNLYAYCLGNPVNYVDPDGADPFKFIITIERHGPHPDAQAMYGRIIVNGIIKGVTLENMAYLVPEGKYKGKLRFSMHEGRWVIELNYWKMMKIKGNPTQVQASIHAGVRASSILNCILVGKNVEVIGEISGSQSMMDELVALIHSHQQAMEMCVNIAMKCMEQAAHASQLGMVFATWAAFDAESSMLDLYYSLMIEIEIRNAR